MMENIDSNFFRKHQNVLEYFHSIMQILYVDMAKSSWKIIILYGSRKILLMENSPPQNSSHGKLPPREFSGYHPGSRKTPPNPGIFPGGGNPWGNIPWGNWIFRSPSLICLRNMTHKYYAISLYNIFSNIIVSKLVNVDMYVLECLYLNYYIQRNLFEILLNQTEIRLYLPCTD